MMLTIAIVRLQFSGAANDHIDVPIEQLAPGNIVLPSAGDIACW